MPRTVAELDRAWRAFPQAKAKYGRKGIEDASWQMPSGHIVPYKAKILPDTIVPGKTCTFFVTEAQGEKLSYELRDKPYEVAKLCQGGKVFTGMVSMADRTRAARLAADKAYHEKNGHYPPLRGARR